MTSFERWPQLDALFEAALDRPPAERDAYLHAACRGDSELRAELDRLIAAHGGASRFLEDREAWIESVRGDAAAEGDVGRAGVDRTPAPESGTIGHYRLLREIGHGGMGTVYLAERADGAFDRQVALKVVHGGPARPEIIARFARERRILARLEHPNVARLYDGGVLPDGRPYLVMEYVDGVPIDEYCDEHRLDIPGRLRLFSTVCAAVHHAHRNVIVHRDLKPSNILVSEDGTVKLLDFGIAKLLDDGLSDTLTRSVGAPLTPHYASPEQLRGESITTASDVYQLGVVLYELLVGHRPHQLSSSAVAQLARVIRDAEPERPSHVLATLDRPGHHTPPTGEEVGLARRTTVERLRRSLRGDLDTIALKAIRREPERRYGSAVQLADDIDRYLGGRPVLARPDTVRYRLGKLLRRHPVGSALTAAASLALLTFAGVVTAQNARISRERDKAEQVTAFLIDVFEQADPMRARGDTLSIYDVLQAGTARIRGDLATQPESRAAILAALGRVHVGQGFYEDADGLLREALALSMTHGAPSDPERLAIVNTLGLVAERRGDLEAADTLLATAAALAAAHHSADRSVRARILNNVGTLRTEQGRLAEADSALTEALELRRGLASGPDASVATTVNNLGMLRLERGELEGADTLLTESLALRRALYGETHFSVAVVLNNLGLLRRRQGRPDLAEARYRQSLAVRRAVLGDDHPELLSSLANLASALSAQLQHAGADSVHRQALDLARRNFGEVHPTTAQILNNLAVSRTREGDLDEAGRLYREALDVRRGLYGPVHPGVANVLYNLGRLEHRRGRLGEADSLLRSALAQRQSLLADGHPLTAIVQSSLGALAIDGRRWDEAQRFLDDALASQEAALPADHSEIADTRFLLGVLHLELDAYERAEPYLTAAYDTYRERAGPDHPQTGVIGGTLVRLYEEWGRPDRARAYESHQGPGRHDRMP